MAMPFAGMCGITSVALSQPAKVRHRERRWCSRLSSRGFYECELQLVAAGRVEDIRLFRCVAMTKSTSTLRNRFVGMCTHFRGSAYPPAAMDLLVRYGLSEIRDEVSWQSVEAKRGQMRMPAYGEWLVREATERGIRPLLIFDYGNQAYDDGGFPNSEEAIAAYARYCAALAGMVRGRVNTFEVWNEWSVGCGMSGKKGENTPEYYARMLQAAHRAVKEVDPKITIVGIGGEHSAHHFDNIEKMIQSGGAKAMDVFSVHSYRYPHSPENSDLVGEIRRVWEMSVQHGGPAKIWLTEIGWPTHRGPRGVDPRTQARYLVRTMALLQSTGVVEKVHWYDFKDDGTKRDYNEHNFGIIGHQSYNYAPKPAVLAASVFAQATADARPIRLDTTDGTYIVSYELPTDADLLIAWCAEGQATVRVEGSDLKGWNLMGHALEQVRSVVLSENPVYLVGKSVRVGQAGQVTEVMMGARAGPLLCALLPAATRLEIAPADNVSSYTNRSLGPPGQHIANGTARKVKAGAIQHVAPPAGVHRQLARSSADQAIRFCTQQENVFPATYYCWYVSIAVAIMGQGKPRRLGCSQCATKLVSMAINDLTLESSASPCVYVTQGEGAYANTRQALQSIDLTPVRGRRVLLKPNVGRTAALGSGVVTHAEVLAAAIDTFRDAGAEVAIGESPIVGVQVKQAFEAAGITAVAQRRQCPLLDMDRRRFVSMPVPEGQVLQSLKVCPEVLEFDFVVSVPVMKMHMHTGATLSVKNMKGCLWRRSKVRLHMLPPLPGSDQKSLDIAIADLSSVLRPHLAILDGTVGFGRAWSQRRPTATSKRGSGLHRRLCCGRRCLPVDGGSRRSKSHICAWAPSEGMGSSIWTG